MIAIAYLRRSKKSDERTVSLDEQRRAVLEYAEKNGFQLNAARCIVDDGVSGGKRERFERIWSYIKASDAQIVIVYQLDRFARDVAGMLDTLRKMSKRGIDFHVIDRGKVEVDTANGFLVTSVEGVMHEHYRRFIAEKTRKALRFLRLKGQRYCNKSPLGYKYRQAGTRWDEKKKMEVPIWKLEPDPKTQPLLIQLTDLYNRGIGIRPAARAVGLGASTVQAVYRRLTVEKKALTA